MAKAKPILKFAKIREDAIIPSREEGNVGYDVYANFAEDAILIQPFETKLIPTGIASIIPSGYAIILKDRGSTGSKGIHTACGVIDSNYRGEWFVALGNLNAKHLIIAKKDLTVEELSGMFPGVPVPSAIIYRYEKAIAQAVLIQDIAANVEEIEINEIKGDETNRGTGALGSTGK